ncbi:MAG TPA: hypothetical protein VMW25_04515 [Clostridia bacterium]|nr:hypothetical protein [Clostridia bacterium]
MAKKVRENTKMEKDENEIELEDTGEIELPEIDVSKYIGTETEIETVKEYRGKNFEGKASFYIIVKTKSLETLANGKELCASRLFGLQEDDEGKIGWGKKTNLGAFLAKYSKSHYKDLVGMKVKVQTTTNKKDGKDYLSFN